MDDNQAPAPPLLNESLYNLDAEQRNFFKQLTGLTDDEELKQHVIGIQRKAYKVFPYPCIRYFTFAKLAIAKLPCYQRVLQLHKERHGAVLLDIGCCFGSDLRKAIFDGWPAENAIASDLIADLWECGHELYKTNPATFPAGFVAGNAFNDSVICLREPLYSAPPTSKPTSLKSLTSLNSLRGHVTAIHASLFFHLFDEGKQLELARRLAGLLSPEPGSVIFGGHYGRPEKATMVEILAEGVEQEQFWHSPESWKEIWNGPVFQEGTVKVEVEWVEDRMNFTELLKNGKIYYIKWCVTRL